jgi:hypothetical protein
VLEPCEIGLCKLDASRLVGAQCSMGGCDRSFFHVVRLLGLRQRRQQNYSQSETLHAIPDLHPSFGFWFVVLR